MHSTEDHSQADGQICLLRRSIKVGEVDASRRTRALWRTRDLEGLRISHSLRVIHPYCKEFECHFGFRAVPPVLQVHAEGTGRHLPATPLTGGRVHSTPPGFAPRSTHPRA